MNVIKAGSGQVPTLMGSLRETISPGLSPAISEEETIVRDIVKSIKQTSEIRTDQDKEGESPVDCENARSSQPSLKKRSMDNMNHRVAVCRPF